MHIATVMIPYCSGTSGWDSTDIKVQQESHGGRIMCHSYHLTCFVVLVDVSGGSNDMVLWPYMQVS